MPQVDVEFGHPVINGEPDGKATIERDQASYSLRAGREAAAWSVEQTSTQGEVRNRDLTPGELKATKFELASGWLERSEMD